MEEILQKLEQIEKLKESFKDAEKKSQKAKIFKTIIKERDSFFKKNAKLILTNNELKEVVEKEIVDFLDILLIVAEFRQTNSTYKNSIDIIMLEFKKGLYLSSHEVQDKVLFCLYDILLINANYKRGVVDKKSYRSKLAKKAWNYIKVNKQPKESPEEK